MSTFKVAVEKIVIESHPNADLLEIAKIGDYSSIVSKDSFKTGDLVAYIPEASIVPIWMQKELGVDGKLAGPKHNMVKAIRLRGVLSQGLVYRARDYWKLGDDVTEELGITKWEPPIPPSLAGEVFTAGSDLTIHYDIENFKRYPNLIPEGTEVVFTEKIHGTFASFCVLPNRLATVDSGNLAVTSKGLGAKGLCMKDNDRNKSNTYMKTAKDIDILGRVSKVFDVENVGPVFVLGEIFGGGIQDLTYDSVGKIQFRVFDIFIGNPNRGSYLDDIILSETCDSLGLSRVPVLYRGHFTKALMKLYTDGKETVSGKNKHIREGIVIRPRLEMKVYNLPGNRLQLKSVSDDYLIRKNATEYN